MAEKKAPKKSTTKKSKSSKSSESVTLSAKGSKFNLNNPKMKKKALIIVGIILVAATLFYFRGLFIVAIVNGQPIPRLALIKELESQSGKQTLDRLITKKLITQEAEKQGVIITQEDIDVKYNEINAQFVDQGQELDQLLAVQGLTRKGFEEELRVQLLVERLLKDEAAVSEEELEEFLENNSDLLDAEDDKDGARERFREQLEQQKLATKYQEFVEALNQNAQINYLVDY